MGLVLAAIIGFLVMTALSFLPILGPLIGGAVAGSLYKKGTINGAKAGFLAGIIVSLFLAILISVIGVLGGFLRGIPILGTIIGAKTGLLLIGLSLYQGILGLIGGLVAGSIKS